MQRLYVVLQKNDDFKPQPIPWGYCIGIDYLVDYLGVNHLALNLRFNVLDIQDTSEQITLRDCPIFTPIKKSNYNHD